LVNICLSLIARGHLRYITNMHAITAPDKNATGADEDSDSDDQLEVRMQHALLHSPSYVTLCTSLITPLWVLL